jgi:hypothetical protein
VTAPAAIPIAMLSSPLRHHERVVIKVFAAPTPKRTPTVASADIAIPIGTATNSQGWHHRAQQVGGTDRKPRRSRRITDILTKAQLLTHHNVRPATWFGGDVAYDLIE